MSTGKFRNVKFFVRHMGIGNDLQKALFKDGCYWQEQDGSKNTIVYKPDNPYLFVESDGRMMSSTDKWCFEASSKCYLNARGTIDEMHKVKKEFTKSDLVPGKHIIKTRNDMMCFVLCNDIAYSICSVKWLDINNLDENFIFETKKFRDKKPHLDVVEVFEFDKSDSGFDPKDLKYLTSIWKREEEQSALEVTIEDIQAKYGQKIKIVEKKS